MSSTQSLSGDRSTSSHPPSRKGEAVHSAPRTGSKSRRGWEPHPLSGGTLGNWFRLLARYGGSIEGRSRVRAVGITLCTLLCTPFRAYETLRYRRQIARQTLDPPPVFIIGHWRSGTTHLHNLMLQDPAWGSISLLQCAIPTFYLTLRRPLTAYLSPRVPDVRPMDNVPTGLDEPMSEDFAMVGWSDLTHYVGYFFPKRLDETFRRTVLFEGVSEREKRHWGEAYRWMLKKSALAADGKRLLLKNPPNTARIREILRLFPDAKFIHVYRNPFSVYASTCRLMEKFLWRFSFQQQYDRRGMEDAVLRRYRQLMERYDAEKDLVPPGNLIEVRHEDSVSDPVGTVARIYEELQLPGFEAIRPRLSAYAESIRDYRMNVYDFDAETIAKVRHELGFLLDRWGYAIPRQGPPKPHIAEAVSQHP